MPRESFEGIVRRHGPTVLRVCRAVVGPNFADDAWSETFLSAMRAYPDLPEGRNVEAWLVTIAHRKAIDQIRARRDVLTGDVPEPAAVKANATATEWESGVWLALQQLPVKQRQTVAYHFVIGLPYAEVAEIVGGTPEAARRAASDGMARLRRTLTIDRRNNDAK